VNAMRARSVRQYTQPPREFFPVILAADLMASGIFPD
jgi:hypothetical protein